MPSSRPPCHRVLAALRLLTLCQALTPLMLVPAPDPAPAPAAGASKWAYLDQAICFFIYFTLAGAIMSIKKYQKR